MTKKLIRTGKPAARRTVRHAAAGKSGSARSHTTNTTSKHPTSKTSPMTQRKAADSRNSTPKHAAGRTVATKGAAPKLAGKAATAKPVADKLAAGKAGGKPTAVKGAAAGHPPAAGKPAANKTVTAVKPGAKAVEARTPASLAKAALKNAAGARKAPPKKSPYTRTQLAPLRRALLDLRLRMIGDLNQMEKEALRADDPDVDVENVADHGSDAFERHMTLGLMEGEARSLRQIGDALEAMDSGRYGLCVVCGEPIPLARLEALPFAPNCVPCQEAHERRQ